MPRPGYATVPGYATAVACGLARKLLLLAAVSLGLALQATTVAASMLANGDMSQAGEGRRPLAGWKEYVWSGQGEIVRHVSADGRAVALIRNDGPAKLGLFQQVKLPRACRYRVMLEAAGHDLHPDAERRAGRLHLAFGTRKSFSVDLAREGSRGWHQHTATVQIAGPDVATVYAFNYGSGAFFVRNVKLEPLLPCTGGGSDTIAPARDLQSPLVYVPPLGPGATLLKGYCGHGAFSRTAVCRAIAEFNGAAESQIGKPRAAPRVLADFEGASIFSGHTRVTGKQALNGVSARLTANRYMLADRRSGLLPDWRGYDWLRIATRNPTSDPQSLYIEINDEKTTGYWSRVNWTTAAAPGDGEVFIPLQVFVGEKSVTRERRRLDLARITRLVVTAPRKDVIIDDIRLEADEPSRHVFPELIRLDLGSLASPVMPGFTRLHAGMRYAEQRGYGFSAATRIARTEDRRHPDSLLSDWVSVHEGGIEIDLPDGRYRVLADDGGRWLLGILSELLASHPHGARQAGP